jgi:2-oxoisovalerate dehydrogenase E1 component
MTHETRILTSDERATGDVHRYSQMLTIRRTEETILELRRQEAFPGSVHLCVGQEVAPVAVCEALGEPDRIIATYRGHGWALAAGVPLDELLAEVLQRATGTNGGRGGSPYLSSPRHRFIGENSIVGAGLPIANGVAMAASQLNTGGVVAVSFGDGATNQGASHEAMVFAVARSLPVVFVCENNQWSEMTPIADTVPGASLSDRARAYGMRAISVNGTDVHMTVRSAAEAIDHSRSGNGPCFLEIHVPRLLGHYNADIEHYRTDDDRDAHRARDPLAALRARILAKGEASATELEAVDRDVDLAVAGARDRALAAPVPDATTASKHVVSLPERTWATPINPQAKMLAYGLAANRALSDELETRPNALSFGEDIAIPGGTFGVTRGLRKKYGERVFDTPISESAILGAAVGASVDGLVPIVEIMWTDFLFVAFDQLLNQAANVRFLSRGEVTAPLVVRMQQGAAPGSCAQHAQSLEALIAHVPGLKVGLPSTPQDAYGMLRAAVADPDPVVVIESRQLYQVQGPVDTDAPVESVGGARVVREGADVAIIAWGRIVHDCLEAANMLEAEGVDALVLDLRWLSPLDEESIARAVRATSGRVVIVHEANRTAGFGAEVAARLASTYFQELDAPIKRVAAPDVRIPTSTVLRDAVIPSARDIMAAVRETVGY